MIVVGLTGSIGMGKSTAAAMLRRQGVPVHDADGAVHALLAPGGGAVAAIDEAFPGVVVDTPGGRAVDRARLGALVFDAPATRARLEAIVHPLVRRASDRFVARWRRAGAPLVVLDIPLLYETGGERRVDRVIVVSAPAFLQARRVLRRPGMTRARLEAIRTSQLADAAKRRRADHVVATGLGRAYTWRTLAAIVATLRAPARARRR